MSGADNRSHSVRIVGNEEEGEAAFQTRAGERIELPVALSSAARVVDPAKLIAKSSRAESYLLSAHEPPLELELLDSGADGHRVRIAPGHYRLALQDRFGVTWDITRFALPTDTTEALAVNLWEAFQAFPPLKEATLRNPYRLTLHLEPGSGLVFEETLQLELRHEK